MSKLGMVLRACVLTVGATVAIAPSSASAASPTTFYVNGSVASSGDCMSAANACKTINEAVEKARLAPGTATIDVAAGTYTEDIQLTQDGDAGLTIDGAGSGASNGTILKGISGDPTITTTPINAGPTTIDDLRIENPSGDDEPALTAAITPLVANNVAIEMQDAASGASAVEVEQSTGVFNQLTVRGSWTGTAIQDTGSLTLTRSSLTTTNSPALALVAGTTAGGHADLIGDSTIQAGGSAPFNVEGIGTNLTIDSSLLLGGINLGVEWVHPYQKERNLTVDGSTIDAGTLGVRDPSTVTDLFTIVSGSKGAIGNVQVEGSILMEQQSAIVEPGSQLTITCSNSDVPSQTQAASTGEGTINCADGENGNTTSEPASLFVAPGTDYNLLPSSSAIDSVPTGAISLPFGLTSSPTDAAGNPRVVDGNGDCVAVQDKGALELQGHSAACPVPPSAPPPLIACAVSSGDSCPPFGHLAAPVIAALKISPSAFFAAPSGATISKTSKKAKKTYGATISYSDSQPTSTTFVIGTSVACKKPSKATGKSARCTPVKETLGTFTYASKAGVNKLHFSGRIKGKKLAKGSYTLEAIQSTASGRQLIAMGFKIKG